MILLIFLKKKNNKYYIMYRIIQASYARTGSTLLLNLIHGFLLPQEPYHCPTNDLIDDFLITKTHDLDINKWINKYKKYKLYFVMSERIDNKVRKKINNKYKKKDNILVINYDEINVTKKLSLDNVIENIFNKFKLFFPKDLIPKKEDSLIKKDMKQRIIEMNKCVKRLKNKPFSYCDQFYGIHGSHRNR